MPKTEFEKTLSTLGALTQSELLLLRGVIDDLLAVMEEESAPVDSGQSQGQEQKTGVRGHIEHKIINGYGPYAYLRVWKGKTLTSTYLGRVRS